MTSRKQKASFNKTIRAIYSRELQAECKPLVARSMFRFRYKKFYANINRLQTD